MQGTRGQTLRPHLALRRGPPRSSHPGYPLPPGAAARSPQLGGRGRRPRDVHSSRPPSAAHPKRILRAPCPQPAPSPPPSRRPYSKRQDARRGPDRIPSPPRSHHARAPHPTPSPGAGRLAGRARTSRAARAAAPAEPGARTWRPGRATRGARARARRSLGHRRRRFRVGGSRVTAAGLRAAPAAPARQQQQQRRPRRAPGEK